MPASSPQHLLLLLPLLALCLKPVTAMTRPLLSSQHALHSDASEQPSSSLLASNSPAAGARRLQDCINAHQPAAGVTTWESFTRDEGTALRVAAAFRSSRPPSVGLTMVTQLSYDRLPQLLAQCRAWPGPISAAVYVPAAPAPASNYPPSRVPPANSQLSVNDSSRPSVRGASGLRRRKVWATARAAQRRVLPLLASRMDEQLAEVVEEARRFFDAAEAALPCQLDVLLVYERFTGPRSAMLYPVNVLRNYARLQARTVLVGLLDVDMLVSSALYDQLRVPLWAASLERQILNKTIFVLPAFSLSDSTLLKKYQTGSVPPSLAALAERLVHTNKTDLWRAFRARDVTRFDPLGQGHVPTDYSRWFRSSQPYTVDYQQRYEPWVLAPRVGMPWHDVRFRGYGQNKIVHVEHLNVSGFRFVVHAQAFLLHRNHKTTRAKRQHAHDFLYNRNKVNSNSTMYGHVGALGRQARRSMRESAYLPVVDAASRACRDLLPWWGPSAAGTTWEDRAP